ncbi:MAG TPA: hypothetical protein VGI22_17895, partial [Xanthobacteraceae bacterium]
PAGSLVRKASARYGDLIAGTEGTSASPALDARACVIREIETDDLRPAGTPRRAFSFSPLLRDSIEVLRCNNASSILALIA